MPSPETALQYLHSTFPADLTRLDENSTRNWGSMNAQQMVEHLTDFFRLSTGTFQIPLAIP